MLQNICCNITIFLQCRTIFLSFSRGYPVSNAEVHAYFTWYLDKVGMHFCSRIWVFSANLRKIVLSLRFLAHRLALLLQHSILSPVYQVGHPVYVTSLTSFPTFCQLQCRKTWRTRNETEGPVRWVGEEERTTDIYSLEREEDEDELKDSVSSPRQVQCFFLLFLL